VWRTRDGEEVEVRARDTTGLETEWRWEGMRRGHIRTWRDDGTIHIEREQKEGDLVRFLRPLPEAEAEPEPQTTTDTLTQIEGQIDQAEPWERLAMALQQQLTESLAERDRLQRELTDMANHAVELLESAQQARDQRDLLAQRLLTKHSEKALQKENSRKQIEINTLKDQLTDRTSERDELASELQAMTEHCRRQHEQIRALQAELDAAGQQPAPADKSEQIERIWDESRERAVSEIIELVIPLQVATGTHAEAVLQILPAVIRRWMDGGSDDVE
jgi:chromosome segregation ATPase